MDVAGQSPDIPGDSLLQRSCIQWTVGRVSGNLWISVWDCFWEKKGLFPHIQNEKTYNCILRQSISVDKNGSNGN